MDIGFICERCESYNRLDARACAACGAPLTAAPAPAAQPVVPPIAAPRAYAAQGRQETPMVAPQGRPCPQCGSPIPLGNRFCGACGHRTDEGQAPAPHPMPYGEGAPAAAKTLFFGAMQTPGRAKLILIKGQGMDGMTYYLQSTEHVAGRSEGPIQFNEVDPLLSPRHANFCYQDNQLYVKDLDSTNGVFLRARAPVKLRSGDTFLVGEQLLRVERSTLEEAPIHDETGTYFYASPRTPCAFKLIQLLHGGAEGASFCPAKSSVRIGRDGNDLNFPDDHFISGTHAEVTATPDGFTLTDLGSKNGTFYRTTAESPLHHGDYVFIGQQLLRVEIT